MSPDPITPVKSPTPVPSTSTSEIARIRVDHFGMNPSTETIYEFVGAVIVNNGVYQSVQVILRYPDSQEYTYDAGSMGRSYPTAKAFSLFPSDRYKGINPEKIIVLDGEQYHTVYRYENGVSRGLPRALTMYPHKIWVSWDIHTIFLSGYGS